MKTQKSHGAAPQPFLFESSPIAPGLTVIEASAGTGKTYAISHLVPRLLLEGSITELKSIALVTFTNDAAKELSDRVRRVMGLLAAEPTADEAVVEEGVFKLRQAFFADPAAQQRLRRAMIDLDQLNVSTIHAFCQRVLQTEGTLCGLPSIPELVPEADDLIEEVLHDLWLRNIARDPLLASIAATRGWNAWEDASVIRAYLPLETPQFSPVPLAWPDALTQLRSMLAELPAHFSALAADLQSSGVLKPKAQAQFVDELHYQIMLGGPEVTEQDRLTSLGWVADLDNHVSTAKPKEKAVTALRLSPANVACQKLEHLLRHLQWSWQIHCAREARTWIEATLARKRCITYDGIIRSLHLALQSPQHGETLRARLAERHLIGIIDESQDTDARQYDIFRRIFLESGGQHRLVLIGDPKQSIYSFRGADVNTYLAARNTPGAKVYTLARTFRSPPALVAAVNAFFIREHSLLNAEMQFHPASSGLSKDKVLIEDGVPRPGRVEAWLVPDAESGDYSNSGKRIRAVTTTVASEIVRLLRVGGLRASDGTDRRLEPGDFAILTNKAAEADAMAAALRERGVAAVISTGDNVMASEEADDLLALFRAVLNPRRSGLRYAALSTRLLGSTAEELRQLRANSELEEQQLRLFTNWLEQWDARGVATLLALTDLHFDITGRLARSSQGERRLTNFRHLCDLLQTTQRRESLRPAGLVAWLSHEIAQAAGSVKTGDEERQLRLESDSRAVQIVTMHKSKGLEYNLVFCPFLWSTTQPFALEVLRRGGEHAEVLLNTRLLDATVPEMQELFRSQLEDRLRLAYVALTRAKLRAWIYCGAIGSGGRAPLKASCLDWLLRPATPSPCTTASLQIWKASVEAGGKTPKGAAAPNPGRGELHHAGLLQICDAAGGQIHISAPPASQTTGPAEVRSNSPHSKPVFRDITVPAIASGWGITSFSALTRAKHEHDSSATLPVQEAVASGEVVAPPCNLFLEARAGAAIGTAIHEWLEEWDFGELDEQALRRHIKHHHVAAADEPEPGTATRTLAMLGHLRTARLQGLDCTIAEACPVPHASEWHFHLPIRGALGTADIAKAFRTAGGPELAVYASMIEAVSSARLEGLLQGFIDRLAFKDGDWGVIDWKTNRLGVGPAGYTQAGILQSAMNEHYMLQTHLYLVALRRHLRLSNPEARSAGAWLVYLRGVHAGTSDGILHINPSEALLDALDVLFT